MIPTTFRLQATKWEAAALAHVSNAVLVVHHFIHELVGEACPDEAVRAELWSFLLDDLTGRYRRAMEHARFLLRVELDGKAVTCNPEFDRALREARGKRLAEDVEDLAVSIPGELRGVRGGLYIHLDDLDRDDTGGGSDAVCAKIHDVMKSYYDVARSRFIDNICVQAVDHFLLSGEASPLRVFDHNRVLSMTADQLEMIAGEDSATRNNRKMLKERIGLLDKALKILRG